MSSCVCRGNVPAFTLCQRKGSFWLQWGSHQEAPRYKPRPHSQVRCYTNGHAQLMLSCCVFTLSNCQTNFPIYCHKVSSWVFTANLWMPPFAVCLSLCSTSRLARIFSFISPSHVSARVFLIVTLILGFESDCTVTCLGGEKKRNSNWLRAVFKDSRVFCHANQSGSAAMNLFIIQTSFWAFFKPRCKYSPVLTIGHNNKQLSPGT